MSTVKDQASSASCNEEEENVETINEDNSTQNNEEDNEDMDVIREDTEDRKPVKKHISSYDGSEFNGSSSSPIAASLSVL